MDIEKQLQQLARAHVESDARWETRWQQHERRMAESDARWEKRMDAIDKRMDKFDKQLQATRKLVEAGIKIFLRKGRETEFKIQALMDGQQRNEALLKSWMRRNTNGHSSR